MRKLLLLITFFTVNCLFSQVKGKTEQSDNSTLYSRVPDGGGVGGDDPIEIDPIDPDEGGATLTLFPPLSGLEAGVTPGELSVSSTGGAIYNIPIVLPPGINKVSPNISLNYSSQSGDGVAGYGWNIGGISRISRVPSTILHDGLVDPVDFDDLDRFALDGQRLILKTGIYGNTGSTYETEIFSNLKISLLANGFQTYFKVEYPDGSVSLYGYSNETSSVLSLSEWPITQWQNSQSIKINYKYYDFNNELHIKSIDFGTNTNTGINKVEFTYKTKNKETIYYVDTFEYRKNKILSSIKITGNGVPFKNYYLTHDLTSTGYERLIIIQEKTGDNTKSLKPITFSYKVNQSSFSQQISYSNRGDKLIFSQAVSSIFFDENDFSHYHKSIINRGDLNNDGVDEYSNGKIFFNLNNNYTTTELFSSAYYIGNEGGNLLNSEYKLNSIPNIFRLGNNNGLIFSGNWFKLFKYNYLSNTLELDYEKQFPEIIPYADNVAISNNRIKLRNNYLADFTGDKLTDALIYNTTEDGYLKFQMINLDRRITTNDNTFFGSIYIGPASFYSSTNSYSGTSLIFHGDYNADGISDLYIISGEPYNKIKVYSWSNNSLVLVRQTDLVLPRDIIKNSKYGLSIGDFNGDGKTDILLAWQRKILISMGNGGFIEEALPISFPIPNENKNETYLTLDFNNDGKSDVLKIEKIYSKQWIKKCSSCENLPWVKSGIKFDYYEKSSGNWLNTSFQRIFQDNINNSVSNDLSDDNILDIGHPLFIKSKFGNDFSSLLAFSGNSIQHENMPINIKTSYFNFNKHMDDQTILVKVNQGNGIAHEIIYNNLMDGNGAFTASTTQEEYPYYNLLNSKDYKVVSEIREIFPGHLKKKLFKYQGAIFDMSGRGMSGFQLTSTTNWHNQPTQIISTINKFDFSKNGALVETFSKVGLIEPNYVLLPSDSFISKTTNKYNYEDTSYVNPLLSNKVFKLFKTKTENVNGHDNTSSVTAVNYNSNNNPINTSITIKNGGTVEKTTVVNFNYDAILSSPYIVDRLNSKTSTTTLSSSGDVYTSEELYDYDVNLLKELKKRTTNSGLTSDFITESNNFDTYGNLIQKKFSVPGMTDRIESYEYDTTTHRYLVKKIDSELQETLYTVDQATGLVLSVKLPSNPNYPLTTSYNYDKWGKLIKTTDYLGKIETQTYSDISSGGTLITIYGSDGSSTKSISDPFGRVIHEGVKNFKNKWTVKSTEYNIYDQPVKIYKNYFDGDTPEVWDEMQYDVYGRLIQANHLKSISSEGKIITYNYNGLITNENDGQKIKTILKNASGEIVSLQETPGENIIYEYFANGTLKKAITSGSTIEIQQDAFGRRKTLIDPSAGTRNYEYNKFGELTKEEVIGKGITEYDLDDNGKLLEKKITEMGSLKSKSTYTYNGNKLLSTIVFEDFTNASQINYSYDYDDYKRLSFKDESGYQFYFQQAIHYDGFGRPEKELYTAINTSDGKRSDKWIKHEYKFGSKYKVYDMQNFTTNGTLLWEAVDVDAGGNITSANFNDGNITMNKTFDSYGFPTQIKYSNDISDYMVLDTEFDPIYGNLTKRTSNLFGTTWTENLVYDQLDRLTDWKDHEGAQSQSYNGNGTINSNKIGNYAYTINSKPFQVSTITPQFPSAIFDYYNNREQNITYDVNKKPLSITELNAENIDFEYNPFSTRSVMYYGGLQPLKNDRPFRKYYSADGSMEIKRNILTNEVEFITYIGGSPYASSMVFKTDGTTTNKEYLYLLNDYQNTINGIVHENGNLIERRQFDVWGNLINFANAIGVTTVPTTANVMLLDRGYTSHEHLLGVNLINMNGRIYDCHLHKFLQPDNNIQDFYNTQNYNRYGYVLNNPTKYTDESGEFWGYIVGALFNAYVAGYQSSGDYNPFNWGSTAWTNAGLGAASFGATSAATYYGNEYISNYNNKPDVSQIAADTQKALDAQNAAEQHSFTIDESWKNLKYGYLQFARDADRTAEKYGQGFGKFIVSFHPAIGLTNAYKGWTEGKDMYGEELGKGWASLEGAAAVLPFLKVGKFFGAADDVARVGLSNEQLIQKSATLAERSIGGTGGVAGTMKHQYASSLLNRYQSLYGARGIETGVYFNNGVGNRGFLDVLDRTNGIIYDFKFGKAIMSTAQYNKYYNNFQLPIKVIRP